MALTSFRPMLRTVCGSIAIVLGVATLAMSDDARIPDKPITAEERDHWAFQPPRRSEPPVVKDRKWVRNPIDAFIRASLDANGLSPAPEAERTTLLRRLSFDLTGLPPSPDEIEGFLNDRSANAYEKVVDRLLASPQYGVRWRSTGSTWLATPTPTASSSTRLGPTPGDTATGSLTPSIVTCPTINSSGSNWPGTRSPPTIRLSSSRPGSIAAIRIWLT